MMSEVESNLHREEDVESALLEVELFLKYDMVHRASERLRRALEKKPQSIVLRERTREVAIIGKQPEEAARQCLALASLYIARDNLDRAYECLLEAKQLDPRISIATGLEAIRRARRQGKPEGQTIVAPAQFIPAGERRAPIFAGDLSAISIFDSVQVIENSRLTGVLVIRLSSSDGDEQSRQQKVFFNDGRIVGAEANPATGVDAFRRIIETTHGTFDFEKSADEFPITIEATSNTNLLLDSLRQLDESKK